MEITKFDFVNVDERARSLGCNIPTNLALLPRNFEVAEFKENLLHESSAATIRVLFRNNNIIETPLELKGEKFPHISEKAFVEWIGPTIFVSSALLSQNPHILSLALGVISNYLTDFFKGVPGVGKVKLDVVVETKKKTCKKIHYEGPVSGLEKLAEVVQEVVAGD
ncbi:MAG: hypothetical protein WHX52_16775 [Anaerolineae bacterium]